MLSVINEHCRDKNIRFDETPHLYYIDGKVADTSVTSLVHQYFEKFDADAIIDKMMQGKNWAKSKYHGKTKDEIKKEWSDSGLEATSKGTMLHKAIEDVYNSKPFNAVPEADEYNQFLQFFEDHKDKLTAYRTEWEVYDEMANLAGSIDMVFKNVDDDTYSIYDWKRTKEIKKYGFGKKGKYPMHNYHDCNFTHYSLQLNIYKYILEKYYDIKIRDMFLICMHPTYVTYQKYQTLDLQEEVTIIMSARENFQLKDQEVEENEVEENES